MVRIQKIVEECLKKMSTNKIFMKISGDINAEMYDPSIETTSDSKGWKPINSVIDDNDLSKLENKIGHTLPQSYREFLKYKHFYELKIPDSAVCFPKHLPDKEVNFLLQLVFNSMVPEKIIGKGFIYFADFEDYGILCFNTNENYENNDYPIVYIDNYNLNEIYPYANNFLELLEADESKGEKFFAYLSNLNN